MLDLNIDPVPASFTIGDLTFRAYDNRIYKDGKDIGMHGRKEYLLLSFLARRAHGSKNKSASREELLKFLYGDAAPRSNALEVFVSRARARLVSVDSNVYLHTVHKVGYELSAYGTDVAYPLAAE